jgi:hypothetical protein
LEGRTFEGRYGTIVLTEDDCLHALCVVPRRVADRTLAPPNLAPSIRAPRVSIRDRAPEPHGNEAREFLRKKLIGKEVNVKMEYTRKVPLTAGEGVPTGEVSARGGSGAVFGGGGVKTRIWPSAPCRASPGPQQG